MFARDCTHAGLAQLVLAHLSERCNDPGIALSSMREALRTTSFRGGDVSRAVRERRADRSRQAEQRSGWRASQLSLEL